MATVKQLAPPLPSGDVQLLGLLVREISELPLDFQTWTYSAKVTWARSVRDTHLFTA
jgi:hypothetical protein